MNTSKRLFAGGVAFMLFAALALAQDPKKQDQLRTVRGVVTDKQENPLPASVVFLKNTRTQNVQSRIADDQGNFRFSGLDPNTDYELHAEKDGAKSPTKAVSSFDTRKDIVLNLKIDRKKS